MLAPILAIGVGGALGGMARFWLSQVINRRLGGDFPWGTLVVNLSGCGLVGALAAVWLANPTASPAVGAWLVMGLLGGYTTVSSFSLETFNLWREGRKGWAGLYILLSLFSCLAATFGAYELVNYIL